MAEKKGNYLFKNANRLCASWKSEFMIKRCFIGQKEKVVQPLLPNTWLGENKIRVHRRRLTIGTPIMAIKVNDPNFRPQF